MSKNIFQRILDGEIKADKVFENDHVLAFKDINPVASVHVLIIPKKFYENLDCVPESEISVIGEIARVAQIIAEQMGVSGHYKLLTNVGAGAGQTVFYMHFHLISGKLFNTREI